MSGKKKDPPTTALVKRERPEPSDVDLAAMIVRTNHLFGRKRLTATFDESEGAVMNVHNKQDVDPKGSYLIYSETDQAFVGLTRAGEFLFGNPSGAVRMRLIFYPAAQA